MKHKRFQRFKDKLLRFLGINFYAVLIWKGEQVEDFRFEIFNCYAFTARHAKRKAINWAVKNQLNNVNDWNFDVEKI